jgi:hypothetical protein
MNNIILILAFISAALNLAYFNHYFFSLVNKQNRRAFFRANRDEDEMKIIMHWVNVVVLILGLVYFDVTTIVLLIKKLIHGDLFNQILAFGYDAISFAFTILTDVLSDNLPDGVSDFIEQILGYFNIQPSEGVVAGFGLLVSLSLNVSILFNYFRKKPFAVRSEEDFLFADDMPSNAPQDQIIQLLILEGCGILIDPGSFEILGMHYGNSTEARLFNAKLFQAHLTTYFEDEGIMTAPIINPVTHNKKYALKREKTFNQLYAKPMKAFNQLDLNDRLAFISLVCKIEYVLAKLIEGSQKPELIKEFKQSDSEKEIAFRGLLNYSAETSVLNNLKTFLSIRKDLLFAEELKQVRLDNRDALKFAETVVKLLLKSDLNYSKEEKQRLFGFIQKCF